MSRQARDQARMLVRLRAVRMQGAAIALAEARAATARAEAERAVADDAARAADATYAAARDDLTTDPGEAERLLAVVDGTHFRQSVARGALNDAREAERLCDLTEADRRKAMIVARARHDRLAEHAGGLARAWDRCAEDREAVEADEARRVR